MSTTLLDEALDLWRFARSGVIAELRNIPGKSFDFSPAPGARTVADLARHIIESGTVMAGELTRHDGDFTRQSYPKFLKEYARGLAPHQDKKTLIGLLGRTLEDGTARFRKAGDVQMLQQITQFNGEPATRLSWMSHGIAHEEYHRGQICVYERLLGRVPALTTLIHGS